MQIPENINRDHLLKAFQKVNQEGVPENAHSSTYDVIFEGKRYPPKLIVSYANIFANGSELNRNNFEGGENTDCFKLLDQERFIVIPKSIQKSFHLDEILRKFLNQAETSSLTTASYPKLLGNLRVKVSFGAGNRTEIPWIAFLNNKDQVRSGIYPVYLYYTRIKKLILAYGVSEEGHSEREWVAPDLVKIKDYFEANNLEHPKRYGNSFIFKVYDISENKSNYEKDLETLILQYASTLEQQNMGNPEIKSFKLKHLRNNLGETNFNFAPLLINRFTISILSKPFLILTGLSGSGKSKLAEAFCRWICVNDNQYAIVPVGADWTNREPLLGYPNALETSKYVIPDNDILNVLMHADENSALPHFIILDEMNLSHVERYFADFLSVMESKGDISLHNSDQIKIPKKKIKWPKNLFIIGTVNIDETTYMFSPKVLDRAHVIEFRIKADEMADFLENPQGVDLDSIDGKGQDYGASFLELAKPTAIADVNTALGAELNRFFEQLKFVGAEFGYRTAHEIVQFHAKAILLEAFDSENDIIDAAIMQKLLPKLHGSRNKLKKPLESLAKLCVNDSSDFSEKWLTDLDSLPENVIKYQISFEKIGRMYRNLLENGYTSYAEA